MNELALFGRRGVQRLAMEGGRDHQLDPLRFLWVTLLSARRAHLVLPLVLFVFAGVAHAQVPVTDVALAVQVQQTTETIAQTIRDTTSPQTELLPWHLRLSRWFQPRPTSRWLVPSVISESAQRTASEEARIRNEERFSGIDPCNVLVSTIDTSEVMRRGVMATGGGGGGGAPRSAPGGTGNLSAVPVERQIHSSVLLSAAGQSAVLAELLPQLIAANRRAINH